LPAVADRNPEPAPVSELIPGDNNEKPLSSDADHQVGDAVDMPVRTAFLHTTDRQQLAQVINWYRAFA
jgi:hypothetical protein